MAARSDMMTIGQTSPYRRHDGASAPAKTFTRPAPAHAPVPPPATEQVLEPEGTFVPSEKHQITLTEAELWHMFVTFSGLLGAGSENEMDLKVAIRLAKSLRRMGITCPAGDALLASRK